MWFWNFEKCLFDPTLEVFKTFGIILYSDSESLKNPDKYSYNEKIEILLKYFYKKFQVIDFN